ncbi:MAG: hypothetical protein FWE87_05480 [Coriobacteriia bacterium]|nr:hypothetical protein [Coriobacteriia bacterium]
MLQTRKPTLVLLGLVIAALIVLALVPTMAFAADHPVTIAQSDTMGQIETKIQNAIDAAAAGDTVRVTGSKTNASDALELTIPSEIKVIWKAVLKSDTYFCIDLKGSGVFEVADGAEIVAYDDDVIYASAGDVYIIVSGGLVENLATFNSDGIHFSGAGIKVTGGIIKNTRSAVNTGALYGNGDVVVTGGEIISTDGYTIYMAGESGVTTTVTGGTISSLGDDRTAIYNPYGNINICGGTVEANGVNSVALSTIDGKIKVYGGTVSATGTDGIAILIGTDGVAAFLDGTCDGRFVIDDGWGIIVKVDTVEVPASWDGTSDGLEIVSTNNWDPDDGEQTVTWDLSGDVPVIVFDLVGYDIVKTINWVECFVEPDPDPDPEPEPEPEPEPIIPDAPPVVTPPTGDASAMVSWLALGGVSLVVLGSAALTGSRGFRTKK